MITTLSNQIFITSLNKAINKSKVYGKLDLRILNIYQMFIYYIEFTEGKSEFNTVNKELKEKLSELKYKFPHIICNYKLQIESINIITRTNNARPDVRNFVIDLDGRYIFNFTPQHFINAYSDINHDPYYKLKIYPPRQIGMINPKLFYIDRTQDPQVTRPLVTEKEFNVTDASDITFIWKADFINEIDPINRDEVDYRFNYRMSDQSIMGSLYSNKGTVTIINSTYVENLPPTIGDIAIEAENREVTTITLQMFTTDMAPPYNDPEGDLIDAIRIDSISSGNKGKFYFDSNEIQIGDIITKQELQNGLFIHIGANIDTIAGDIIGFSARDTGSLIWVQ